MLFLYALAPIALLLAISAFFSAAETSLTAVSRGRMHQLEQDGSKAAARVNRLVGNRERMIGAVLLGNTFINILASSLTTALLEDHLGKHAVAVTTGVMTVVILIFVEVLPKTLAIARTDAVALALAWPLQFLVGVLSPVIASVQWLVWRVLWLFGVRAGNREEAADAAHEDIRGSVALHHQEGNVEREHRDMIDGILDLRELRVADVMQHRKQMTSLDIARPAHEIVEAVTESEHTRIPLWRGEPDNIIGVLNAKHLAQALVERRGKLEAIDIETLLTTPWFVPDTTSLEEQLEAFRERRSHFALVVDEYGTLQGLVTLEDILAEIFGELPDEHQQRRPDVRRRPDGTWLVDGSVPVRELNREYEWNLPDDGATTVAGLVIQEAGTIPEPGQRFAFFGFTFEILRRQRNQITALKVTPPPVAGDARPE
jgi:Mg2+/Co2+ transporter CorB